MRLDSGVVTRNQRARQQPSRHSRAGATRSADWLVGVRPRSAGGNVTFMAKRIPASSCRPPLGPCVGFCARPHSGLLLTVPAFVFMNKRQDLTSLLLVTTFLSILLSFASASALVLVTEAFPQRIRAGSLGLIYALAISIFEGSAQFVETLLMRITGGILAPAWYMSAALAIGMVGLVFLKEQGPEDRAQSNELTRLSMSPGPL